MPLRITEPDRKQLQRLLPGLPPEAVEELAAKARQVTFRAGETIMGERGRWSPAVITDGLVRLTIRSRDGREATLRLSGRGVIVGLVGMFDPDYSNDLHERSMVAVERSTLVFLDSPSLMRMCQRYSGFTLHLLRQTVEWGGALVDAAGQFAFMSVRQRLAGHLLGLASEDAEGRLVASATQQQLANAIGSVREVVARTLHEFREDGLVDVSRARVTVLDRKALARDAYHVT
jgi:CRP/FNR family transcriptional regulator, cyclic AMP receptor protein